MCSVNTHHRNDPSSPWGGIKSSGVGSENGIGKYLQPFFKFERSLIGLSLDAYHAYTTTKSTIINYASVEEGLKNDDWFREGTGEVRYG
jgi:acyl-CoA reductase-like NAD-dependent aldehyde dehydrogenase